MYSQVLATKNINHIHKSLKIQEEDKIFRSSIVLSSYNTSSPKQALLYCRDFTVQCPTNAQIWNHLLAPAIAIVLRYQELQNLQMVSA